MKSRIVLWCAITASITGSASGQIVGQHHFRWWDDPQVGVIVTPQGAPAPTPASLPLFDLDEWHLNQGGTTQWYGGGAIVGLPANPFNAANRNGLSAGSVIPVIAGAEAFIYQITNVGYFNGNGPPPNQMPPYSFTTLPAGLGSNDLSGINIQDTHGALQIAAPVGQFMSSANLVVGTILDLTAAAVALPGNQDWNFNAFTGPGNFEWDISTNGIGASMAVGPIVFGYAMPGNWLDAVNNGHVHSWGALPGGGPMTQVNVTPVMPGFSGPVPAPSVLFAAFLSAAGMLRRRR